MRNDTAAPVTLHVAFPLPVLPVDTPAGFDLLDPAGTSTAHNIHLPSEARPNFVNFRVWADGREIAPDVEIRAVLPSGRDIAGRLRDMGAADLLLHPRILIVGDPDYGIDRPLLHELQNLGAVSGDGRCRPALADAGHIPLATDFSTWGDGHRAFLSPSGRFFICSAAERRMDGRSDP
jgi:hypothetical protein